MRSPLRSTAGENPATRRSLVPIALLCLGLLFSVLLLDGCGQDEELDTFYADMELFIEQANADFADLNAIDPTSETAVDELLASLDALSDTFQSLADIPVPEEFSSIEELADDAAYYMAEAAILYAEAYADEGYAENVAEAAQENYDRAIKRLEYISIILQGDVPDDENVTVTTEESDAPGFKEDADDASAGDAVSDTGENTDSDPAEDGDT